MPSNGFRAAWWLLAHPPRRSPPVDGQLWPNKNMPQRTNDFQRPVKLIHQAMSGSGATITESALISAPGLGELREIDILIETAVPPYKIKVAVEAKDHRRKLNVTDIEAIIGKYRGAGSVPVDKVVVVSRNGCSRQASRKATLAGIELRQLSETKESDWKALLPFSAGQQLVLPRLPHIADLEFEPPLPSGSPCPFCEGLIVNKQSGREIDPPMRYVAKVTKNHLLRSPDFVRRVEAIRRDAGSLPISFNMEKFALRLRGVDYPLKHLKFRLFWADKSAPLQFHSYDLTGEGQTPTIVKHGVAHFDDHKIEILLPDGLQSKNIAISISATKKKT
jgi:hypothetical protein